MGPAAREGARRRSSTIAGCARSRAAEIENIIRNGMPNGMPPFGSMPEADLQAVTAFVRSFNASAFDLQPAGDVAAGRVVLLRQRAVRVVSHRARARRSRRAGPVEHRAADDGARADASARRARCRDCAGYATARVQLKDGRTLRGFVRNEGNHVLPLQTVDGRLVAVDKRTADDHARNWIGDAAAEGDTGRNARSDRVSQPARGGTDRSARAPSA